MIRITWIWVVFQGELRTFTGAALRERRGDGRVGGPCGLKRDLSFEIKEARRFAGKKVTNPEWLSTGPNRRPRCQAH